MMSLNNDICTLLITLLHNLNQRTYGVVEFQKLEIPKSTLINKEESKEQVSKTNEIFKAKQLIDQYFKIYQNPKTPKPQNPKTPMTVIGIEILLRKRCTIFKPNSPIL